MKRSVDNIVSEEKEGNNMKQEELDEKGYVK